ncbi:HD domain-containing protein [bacterium]|nr:MAG: HD domain-containing protein [bacterium]
MSYERRYFPRVKRYIRGNFEQLFVLITLLSVMVITYFLPNKVAFINFFYLPVVLAGYYVGLRFSVLGAFFCVLLVALYTILYPAQFVLPPTNAYLLAHLIGWGSFLLIVGFFVGIQHDKLKTSYSKTKELNRELYDSLLKLKHARTATILGLAKLAEFRDEETGKHLDRIQEYCRVLAEELTKHPDFGSYITPVYVEDLCLSSILHDIGKVGIPDAILQKPGKLTPKEYEAIKIHTTLGGEALGAIENKLTERSFLTLGKEVAFNHHERWDGSGYPRGLAGEDIPLSARIVSVADVYDSVTSDRCYQKSMSHEEAIGIIAKGRGTAFDPRIADAFLARQKAFNLIRIGQHQDDPVPAALQSAVQPPAKEDLSLDKVEMKSAGVLCG